MMQLKRIFNEDGDTVTHVNVKHQGKEWRPSPRVINKGTAEGWLSMADGVVTLKTGPDDDDVQFRVIAPPGYYCVFDGEPCSSSKAAQAYVKKNFKGKKSPSARFPAGYAKHNFYMLEKVDA